MTRLPAAALLGQNVRRLCEEQGMSTDTLARILGWSGEALADLRAGSLDISLDQLDQLCAALRVAPQYLFNEDNQKQQLRYG